MMIFKFLCYCPYLFIKSKGLTLMKILFFLLEFRTKEASLTIIGNFQLLSHSTFFWYKFFLIILTTFLAFLLVCQTFSLTD